MFDIRAGICICSTMWFITNCRSDVLLSGSVHCVSQEPTRASPFSLVLKWWVDLLRVVLWLWRLQRRMWRNEKNNVVLEPWRLTCNYWDTTNIQERNYVAEQHGLIPKNTNASQSSWCMIWFSITKLTKVNFISAECFKVIFSCFLTAPVDSAMARGCICCVKYMLFLFNLLFWVIILHTHTHTHAVCEETVQMLPGVIKSAAVCFSWAAVGCWASACGCPSLRAASPPCRPPSRRSPPPTSSSPWALSSWWRVSWGAWVPSKRISACCWVWVHYNTHNASVFSIWLLFYISVLLSCCVQVGWEIWTFTQLLMGKVNNIEVTGYKESLFH